MKKGIKWNIILTGDVCDPDIDGDGVTNEIDNCPYLSNPLQTDINGRYLVVYYSFVLYISTVDILIIYNLPIY